jgi:TolB-like protein/class 3 adenylate cyclase
MKNAITGDRQLACIMFTDIAGYTAMMGEDEEHAFEILQKNRDIQRPAIENYGGRWIKEMGDGVLATFSSATNAVHAAVAIQHLVKQENSFKLRIGLHLSEVVFENGDVFGDGVNIAARIQTRAEIGGILISETVNKNLTNKKGITTRFLGEESLKHVKTPVQLFVLETNEEYYGVDFPIITKEQLNVESPSFSIAVLPFRNASHDEENEFLCEGIAEDIIITLSNIKHLRVVGRRSSFQFKGGETPLAEIAKMLNVNRILDGSIRKHGNLIRVNAELINVEDDTQIWAEKYDRELTDMFQIQDDISTNIAENLKLTFVNDSGRAMPLNMEAYELVLKGRYYVERFLEGFEKANACFTRAIEIDPYYADAYCELGKLYFMLTASLFYAPTEGFAKAQHYAEKALSLNKELAAAHYVLGQVNLWHLWNFDQAKKEFEVAAACKIPSYFTGIVYDPWYTAMVEGDFEEAINACQKIIENDPLSLYAYLHLGYIYVYGGHLPEGRAVFEKILSLAPYYSEALRMVAMSYSFEGNHEKALELAQKAAEMGHGIGWTQNFYIIALARMGEHEEARKLLAEYEVNKGPLSISHVGIALVHVHLGDVEAALDCIEKGLDNRDVWAFSMKYSCEFDSLRDNPRFLQLLERVGFPQVQHA